MTTSFLRNTALALIAVAGLSASPAFAGGFVSDEDVIYADRVEGGVREDHRPAPPREFDHDWVRYQDDFLSPRQVSRIIRGQGYGRVTQISLRGDVYRVVAVRPNGAVVKLSVDAETGDVLSARRVGWEPRHHREGSGLTIEFGWDNRR